MEELFKDVEERCRKANFIESIMEKAHYAPEDRELLWSVLEKILACVADGAGVGDRDVLGGEAPGSSVREVVMTLGKGVDELQDQFLSDGLLTEAYMVEVLGSEILLLAYAAYNSRVKEHTDYSVRRYYFLGSAKSAVLGGGSRDSSGCRDAAEAGIEVSLELETLPAILERSGLPVACTEGYCMVPKKSVAFYAELTKDKTVTCEGICMGCGREDCPNRMAAGERQQGNRALDRPLTYGYARILGLSG